MVQTVKAIDCVQSSVLSLYPYNFQSFDLKVPLQGPVVNPAVSNPTKNTLGTNRVGLTTSDCTWATEMVHLSKYAEFHEYFNGHTFHITTQL